MNEEPKDKVITFRLSKREYAVVKVACGLDQSSISAMARRTILAWAETLSARPKVDQRLASIEGRLDTLCKLLDTRDE
jgi:hypothetical protein